ncbi:hypothetical protein K437DRAFT_223154 [Tilletiaria anomala UBC 951]|uniref:RING-type E3 ubiquitin transferase n=1 Tax=Tilletiaria anomala (strain ATCC 24038 / CBS 436.72 / UBC 951) TaxID=1037660 RepID=A0A066W036_TILAU|nr:uncharacterized protein K437DRAFT_223154 [Tilletiaria anomala UBC 951]KDN47327.1 hypothetical protein K437DRAFT_223154 [Tilletiaria anomala UBC 951]
MCQRLRHAEKLANEAERRGVAESAGTDAGASSNATAATGTGAGAERGAAVAELDDAAAVRRNLLLGVWASYAHLTRGRKLMFFFRLGLALAQVAVSIVILALPTSLGDSFAADRSGINGGAGGGDPTCDPEPLFAWLFLHMLRVTVALPLDVYLGLSPHRTSRARRPNAQGLEERERARTFGSLLLDRKISKISDLINIVHLVLFIVGNHIVYSNTECSRAPADSVPLFWTSFSMLCITYLIILEILLLVFAIVFFLPCVMFAMRALGLGERLQGKQPPTSKVPQKVADAVKLVYYTPEEVVKETEQATDGAAISAEAADNERPPASSGAEDLSTVSSGAADDREWEKTAPASKRRVGGGLVRLFRVRRHSARHFQRADITRSSSSCSDNNPSRVDASAGMCAAAAAVVPSKKTPKLKYPLHALPAHRATCPICLCDFERPEETLAREGMEPEPLRLLDCGHTFHKSCVDEWLTTVSGRCPVCQKPIRKDKVGAGAGAQDGATEA